MKNTEFQARTESYWVNDELTKQLRSIISLSWIPLRSIQATLA